MAWLPSGVRLFKSTSAPGATDDMNKGYAVGDVIVDEANDNSYQCQDNAAGAAVWAQLDATGGVGDHGGLTGLGDDDHAQYLNNSRGDARYLYRENIDAFTPDGDYEPATKKYVDDTAGGITEAEAIKWAIVFGGM